MPRSAALAVFLVLVPVASAADGVHGAAAVQKVFRDATGEHAAGPDITSVTASSDGTSLTVRVAIPGNPVVTEDMRLRIWLDADDDRGTGLTVEGLEGLDNFLLVDPTRFRLDEAVLGRCQESVCSVGPTPSLTFTYASGATFTLDADALELRRIERLAFSAEVAAGIGYDPVTREYDFTNWRWDRAPDQGAWVYDARALHVASFRFTPAQPRAGRPLTLSMDVVRTDSGHLLARGTVTCSLGIGGRSIAPRSRGFTGRRAECVFQVPPGSKGKRYRATIGVGARGAVVTRSVSGRIG